MMSIDDEANVNTMGILTNSGGVQFNKGMQVTGGSSISYDANNSLQLSSLGTNITGPLSASNGLTVGAISPNATGNLKLNGYGPTKLVIASTGVSLTGNFQANHGILADQITPSLHGSLQLNGNNTNTKIVLGTGTANITGTTVGITGTTSITGSLTSSGCLLYTSPSPRD